MKRSGRLEGKVVLVTGAASGIGLATAKLMVDEGAQVIAVDMREQDLWLLENIEGMYLIHADVMKSEDIAQMKQEIAEKFGHLDALCNIAGINDLAYPLLETTDERWELIIGLDLTAPFRVCRELLPLMLEAGSGAIVNVASYAALRGNHGPSYSAAKAGLIGLSKSIAFRYAAQGIRCNVVNPGGTRTKIIEHSIEQAGGTYHEAGADLSQLIRAMPVHSYLEPEEVGAACVFLCSDEAKAINGAVLAVDGGMSVC
jgi:NAD(P)-dependent dehydrogenase (short-subunit alcohol dehydrogenase family)